MLFYYFLGTFLYLFFVIYGSLVPLEFNPLPLGVAVVKFQQIPYLDLGIESRADWLANLLLYIPLAFFASAMVSVVRNRPVRILLLVIVFILCVTLAIAIEFMQLFFPPRTVSINDLIAEIIGSSVGILCWHYFGAYFHILYRQIVRANRWSVKAAIIFYLFIYGLQSLMPFDFVMTFNELNEKLASGHDAFFLSVDSCAENKLRCGLKLGVEMLLLLPLGFLFCYLRYIEHKMIIAVLVGFFLGLIIEFIQVFLFSGMGQGISVVTRMLGMALGVKLFELSCKGYFTDKLLLLRPICWLAVLPYVIIILSVNGLMTEGLLTQGEVANKFAETHFLPFYYSYYSHETVALVSLLNNTVAYLPIGILFWGITQKIHWFLVGLTAAIFAVFVEIGKLFKAPEHADPTDILIAFIAASFCYVSINTLIHWVARLKTDASTAGRLR
jgi:VanZ family protein